MRGLGWLIFIAGIGLALSVFEISPFPWYVDAPIAVSAYLVWIWATSKMFPPSLS